MKIFPAQIYCLFLFGFDSKKVFDAVCKHHAIVFVYVFSKLCISSRLVSLIIYKFKISRPKYLFLTSHTNAFLMHCFQSYFTKCISEILKN